MEEHDLGHLYDATCHHDLSSLSASPSGPRLIPDVLPAVIRVLDPKDDLPLLLTLQRVSRTAWELSTMIIYEKITVSSWYKLLRPPKGLKAARKPVGSDHDEDCTRCGVILNDEHLRSTLRRRKAFSYVKEMTIRVFPTAYSVACYNICQGHSRTCPHRDPLDAIRAGAPSKLPFNNLTSLRIEQEAMLPYIPGGRFERYGLGLDGEEYPWVPTPMRVPYPLMLKVLVRPERVCLTMPFTRKEHLVNFTPGDLVNLRWQDVDLDLGIRRALITLLHAQRPYTEFSIHAMAERWIPLTVIAPLRYKLHYPLSYLWSDERGSVDGLTTHVVLTRRAESYVSVLKQTRTNHTRQQRESGGMVGDVQSDDHMLASQPGHDIAGRGAQPVKKSPKTPPIATWVINGEHRSLSLQEGDHSGRSLLALLTSRMLHTAQTTGGGHVHGDDLGPVFTDKSTHLARFTFTRMGHEEACDLCGRS